jgi:hypothetical protein
VPQAVLLMLQLRRDSLVQVLQGAAVQQGVLLQVLQVLRYKAVLLAQVQGGPQLPAWVEQYLSLWRMRSCRWAVQLGFALFFISSVAAVTQTHTA